MARIPQKSSDAPRSMGIILDSSILIAAEREHFDLERMLRDLDPKTRVGIAAITAAELLHGVGRANTPERRVKREQYVEAALGKFPIFGFELAEAREYSRLWLLLQASGWTDRKSVV